MSTRKTFHRSTAAVLLACLAPATAIAHPGHEFSQHLIAGLQHPLGGLDHLLLIVAMGAWAGLMAAAGRIVIAFSLALFVGVGALLPIGGGALLEAAIALTVVGAGALLALGKRWPLGRIAALAAAVALIHGIAHGAEGPASDASYVIGLMLATGTLSIAASFAAAHLQKRKTWLRAAGIASAATGLIALAA
jgi:urease accessory protein